MSSKKREIFTKGPESAHWDRLKGRHVTVFGATDVPVACGKLVWVDVYTFGVLVLPNDDSPLLVYKGPGVMVALTKPNQINEPWRSLMVRD